MTVTSGKISKAFHRTPNDTNTYHFLSEKVTVLVSGEDTNGEYSVAHIIEPPKLGPPLHIHENDDETFYILKGQFTFFVGDDIIEAKPGDYVFAPRGIPHRFLSGSEQSEFIVTASPAGFDQFVKQLGTSVPKDAPLPEVKPPSLEELQHLVKVSGYFNITYPDLKF
ncbi:cupin domain-containing protein [Peribacillus saganii]|uniref:Cupin domain-containing protein n=1 Tax=Peribacillus saganii TaxID=2303992 RepID=A0A372LPX7_9BACI|nr:cupin domain-containing protein [Peribacillus saganii]RFU70170.1 cupin domain-containing protein [Peribacillus saganii]